MPHTMLEFAHEHAHAIGEAKCVWSMFYSRMAQFGLKVEGDEARQVEALR